MNPVTLEAARLKDVDDAHYYGASCSACGHHARLSIRKLTMHLGEEFPLVKIRPRLRCEKCASRQCIVTFLTPERLSGSLTYLRSEPPSRE